jgi:polyisoprenoid-binding protein YceI
MLSGGLVKFARTLILLAVTATLPLAAQSEPETWTLDKSHSQTTFRIRHLMSNVSGTFGDFDAAISLDRSDLAGSSIEFTIQAASIDTRNENRDKHLRSADFFDVEKFPLITFKSSSIKARSDDQFDVAGDLTMHGVTRRVTLPVTFLGFLKDPRGNEKAGFEIATTINRKDYGIVWNRNLDEGGVLLGDDVRVSIDLQFAKRAR